MNRLLFDIIDEPRGEVMCRLIRSAGRHSSSAMLVVRDSLGLDEAGQGLLSRMAPHLLERKRSSSWPGTKLIGGEATVFRFALSRSIVDEIATAADGLYSWKQPALPEDLALLRDDGTALLGSISHEQDAFLEVTEEEYRTLTAEVTELGMITRRRT